jgi:hypothetical protein
MTAADARREAEMGYGILSGLHFAKLESVAQAHESAAKHGVSDWPCVKAYLRGLDAQE